MCLWTWLHRCSFNPCKWNGTVCDIFYDRLLQELWWHQGRCWNLYSFRLLSFLPSYANMFYYFLCLQILSYPMLVMNVPDFTSHVFCLLPKPLIHHHYWLQFDYLSTFPLSHKLFKGRDSFLLTIHMYMCMCVPLLLAGWRVNVCSTTSLPYPPSTVKAGSWVWLLSGFLSINLQDENMLISKFPTYLNHPTV